MLVHRKKYQTNGSKIPTLIHPITNSVENEWTTVSGDSNWIRCYALFVIDVTVIRYEYD